MTLSVTEFKVQFSNVIKCVKAGEEIIVTYGRKKQIVGVFKQRERKKMPDRKIGIYDNMQGYKMAEDFNLTTRKEFPI